MSCQAQSVDLNPIELVWDDIDWKVRAKQLTSAANLWQLWVEVCSVYLQSLVEKMPRIYEAVIVAKGAILMMEKKCFVFFLGLI